MILGYSAGIWGTTSPTKCWCEYSGSILVFKERKWLEINGRIKPKASDLCPLKIRKISSRQWRKWMVREPNIYSFTIYIYVLFNCNINIFYTFWVLAFTQLLNYARYNLNRKCIARLSLYNDWWRKYCMSSKRWKLQSWILELINIATKIENILRLMAISIAKINLSLSLSHFTSHFSSRWY